MYNYRRYMVNYDNSTPPTSAIARAAPNVRIVALFFFIISSFLFLLKGQGFLKDTLSRG